MVHYKLLYNILWYGNMLWYYITVLVVCYTMTLPAKDRGLHRRPSGVQEEPGDGEGDSSTNADNDSSTITISLSLSLSLYIYIKTNK